MPKTFADTTALFEHQGGTTDGRRAVRALLRPQPDVATSEHVIREWKRIVVAAVGAILYAVENETDLSGAFARLGNGHGRASAQRWRAAAMITGRTFDPVEAKIRGRQLLRGLEPAVSRTVGTIRTASQCGLAREEPYEIAGKWVLKSTCTRREGICDHEQRIAMDLERWRNASDALAKSDREADRRVGSLGQKMAASPPLRTGVNCYGRTGDLAIALDCGSDELLVTTDESFELIGQALGFAVRVISVR